MGGRFIGSGFWKDWRVDEERNFIDIGDHGGMRTNASGIRYIGRDDDGEGRFEFWVMFTDISQLNQIPGTHLAGIASNPLSFRPYVNGERYPADLTRIDLGRPRDGLLRVTSTSGVGEGFLQHVYTYDIPIGLGRWGEIDLRWRHVGDNLDITINGHTHSFPVLPNTPRLGTYIYFGNMDHIVGYIEIDNLYYEQ